MVVFFFSTCNIFSLEIVWIISYEITKQLIRTEICRLQHISNDDPWASRPPSMKLVFLFMEITDNNEQLVQINQLICTVASF